MTIQDYIYNGSISESDFIFYEMMKSVSNNMKHESNDIYDVDFENKLHIYKKDVIDSWFRMYITKDMVFAKVDYDEDGFRFCHKLCNFNTETCTFDVVEISYDEWVHLFETNTAIFESPFMYVKDKSLPIIVSKSYNK